MMVGNPIKDSNLADNKAQLAIQQNPSYVPFAGLWERYPEENSRAMKALV